MCHTLLPLEYAKAAPLYIACRNGQLDVARLLRFQTTDAAVAAVDNTGPYPVVVGRAAGSALIFVRAPSFVGVNVNVSATPVAVSRLTASVVTRVSWSGGGDPSVAGRRTGGGGGSEGVGEILTGVCEI